MAARGSHWSFAEKARFEAALHRYGPFAWDHIIRAVGTRSEKQVKAYAARYRRRKKLAAKAQQEAVRAFAAAQLNAAAAAAAAAAANHSLALSGRAPNRAEAPKSEPRLATIMPADFRAAPSVHLRSPDVSSPFACNFGAVAPAADEYDHWSSPVRTLESTPQPEPRTPPLTASGTPQTEADDGTDGDAFGTDLSAVESSSNTDSVDDVLVCDGATEQDDGLVHLMRAASEPMADDEPDRRLPFECTLLRDGDGDGDGDDWTLADRLGDELLDDALLGAPL
ncbi:Myb [Gracilaria domingensis]|nr:Myb [Gracilaria domingensis]